VNSIKKWWYAERENRPEAGTSQDMCPTNGDAVIFQAVMVLAWVPLAVCLAHRFFNAGGGK
jgi:hypothetical protein